MMIKRLGFIVVLLSVCSMYSQQITVKEAFLEKWSNSKTYLMALAESMPEDKFSFKPTEGSMDFKSQLLHIRGNMLWLSTTHFSDEEFDMIKLREESFDTKQDILKALETAFDLVYQRVKMTNEEEFVKTVDFFAGAKSKLQILNLLHDHVTHHRGQLVVYLNLNGIKPAQYVGW